MEKLASGVESVPRLVIRRFFRVAVLNYFLTYCVGLTC